MLIQCMSTTTHSLSNQTACWSNVALQIPDALPDEYQRCLYTVLNDRPFSLKLATTPLHHGGYTEKIVGPSTRIISVSTFSQKK